jgi:hypothetical protein
MQVHRHVPHSKTLWRASKGLRLTMVLNGRRRSVSVSCRRSMSILLVTRLYVRLLYGRPSKLETSMEKCSSWVMRALIEHFVDCDVPMLGTSVPKDLPCTHDVVRGGDIQAQISSLRSQLFTMLDVVPRNIRAPIRTLDTPVPRTTWRFFGHFPTNDEMMIFTGKIDNSALIEQAATRPEAKTYKSLEFPQRLLSIK